MDDRQRVLMSFTLNRTRKTWTVFFRQPPRPQRLGREYTFEDADKIRNLYQRFGSEKRLEDQQAFEYAIDQGNGLIVLMLGPEQMAKLVSMNR